MQTGNVCISLMKHTLLSVRKFNCGLLVCGMKGMSRIACSVSRNRIRRRYTIGPLWAETIRASSYDIGIKPSPEI